MPAPRRILLGAVITALLLSACTAPKSDRAVTTPPAGSTTPAVAPQTPAAPTGSSGVPATPEPDSASLLPEGDFETGLDVPWGLARLTDGTVLVSERDTTQVVRLALGKSVPLGRVPGVRPNGEGGLHGIATDPTDQQVFFVHYAAGKDNKVPDSDCVGPDSWSRRWRP